MRAAKAWGVVLVLALTWPFFLPGEAFALRDMMVLPDMALTRAALGFGDLPARNVPQDALLGVLPVPVLIVRVMVVAAAACAARAGWRAAETAWGRSAAMTVAVWNPFVVERLLQGQWSLAVAAWLMPWIAVAPAWGWRWLASLTPTGALAAVVSSRSLGTAVFSAALCLPWVVPGMLASGSGTASAASADVFAPRAEEAAGTLGTLAGLGGIWNGAAVPDSREAGFALFGIALVVVLAAGWRGVEARLLVLAALGVGIALASWGGALAWAVTELPGGGLLRDAHKWLILALPAFVRAAGALPPRAAPAALALALLQVPDAAVAVAALRPVDGVEVPAVDHRGRDVFFVDRPALVLRPDGAPAVDPAPKVMNVVEPGELVVDGVVVDEVSPRWRAAAENVGDAGALRGLGIGLVVYPDGRVVDTGAPARDLPPTGVALLVIWVALGLWGCTRRTPY
ncbi:hypothetical protein [Corynebacterium timonense]|uniref:Uncharacterized protein n=1 Tax=Corynebacterium timonense TaxID=441500 RepID=A0A1H1VCG6_9CORY|nr:hypothetical protein [Corynebacterium timonense]SDS81909.1 hypothetical protein SAMN04488539_2462 [Corynebacterium timonense]